MGRDTGDSESLKNLECKDPRPYTKNHRLPEIKYG